MRGIQKTVLFLVFGTILIGCEADSETAVAEESTVMSASSSPEGAVVYIISPENGDTVDESFVVRFGLSGMGIAPAGVDVPNTGHHHLLVDIDGLPSLDEPMLDQVRHFGGGQTETTLTLEPGEHTLQLILGNQYHIPHDPPVISEKIKITVK